MQIQRYFSYFYQFLTVEFQQTCLITECHYNVVQYNMILHISLQWLRQNTNQSLNAQNTPYISRPHEWAIGCLLWGIWRKLTALFWWVDKYKNPLTSATFLSSTGTILPTVPLLKNDFFCFSWNTNHNRISLMSRSFFYVNMKYNPETWNVKDYPINLQDLSYNYR